MDTETKTWITGEEFTAEWQRLRAAGELRPDAPGYRALLERVAARDRYLFERYGKPLLDRHHGKRVAISLSGEVILGDQAGTLLREAAQRFGAGNFAVWKLSDPPADVLR